MLRARKKIFFSVFLSFWLFSSFAYAKTWRNLTPGVDYIDLKYRSLTQWSHIHAFRIDLNKTKMSIAMAENLPNNYASAQAFRHFSQSLIAINGGFFNPDKTPLGLRISETHVLNPVRHISWWGVFYIQDQRAFISTPFAFQLQKNVDFAIQSGPRLVVNGQIPHLRTGYANRSVLGIDTHGKVIILVTENLPISTSDLAHIMVGAPFNCVNALNLDGGSSSQLNAKIDNFKLDVPGFTQVSDAVIVKRR